ncbi:MAG: ADP-ribosylglycohydrolase family protein [Cyanobacteria bacterium]|nr:ADP-ribosylglycohydrolase family protein [Cyanobacteriota bacterium]
MDLKDRFRGCLVGLAAGDALGTTLEFLPPLSFEPLTDMIGGGPFKLKPGQWTDDTSMALCLAESLVLRHGFDPLDQMQRYLRWRDEGYMSCLGRCFDIGNTTSSAISAFVETGEPYSGLTSNTSQANGSMMRLAPVPMYFHNDIEMAIERSADSSRTTHGHQVPVDACRYLGALIVCALNGVDREDFLKEFPPLIDESYWSKKPLDEAIAIVARGSYKAGVNIQGSAYTPKALEAALWAFHKSSSFEEGALLAVNLGDDSDTTGAIFGQLAGAYYGINAIPEKWRHKIAMLEKITHLADQLLEQSLSVR